MLGDMLSRPAYAVLAVARERLTHLGGALPAWNPLRGTVRVRTIFSELFNRQLGIVFLRTLLTCGRQFLSSSSGTRSPIRG